MKRNVIKINETLCNGCGQCVEGCHEGALQLIDGKAVLISEMYCDGLGACIGDCPVGAITIEEREAEEYDEKAVMQRLLPKGDKVIAAHLKHLYEHEEYELIQAAEEFLRTHRHPIPLYKGVEKEHPHHKHAGGCPGSHHITFDDNKLNSPSDSYTSALQQWPVQLHLLNPTATFLRGADLVLAADCVAYAVGDFHVRFLKDKRLAIACPKLDNSMEIYREKLTAMINEGGINTLTVIIMEVPCCGGLLQLCKSALQQARRKVPLKLIRISLKGETLNEEWL